MAEEPGKPKETRKLVAVSCGEKMGNTEILLKEACMAAEGEGVAVELIRLLDLKIEPCRGCKRCNHPESDGDCVIKDDDIPFLLEKIHWDDCGLIVGAPVYFLTPPGLFKLVVDRTIPYIRRRPEAFLQKTRVGAAIGVGGSDVGWVNFCLPLLNSFLMLTRELVDQMQAFHVGESGHVLLKEDTLARARQLGRSVAAAMSMPAEQVHWMGDEPGLCPVCHSNLLEVDGSLPKVTCPVCNIKGVVRVDASAMAVRWEEGWREKRRWGERDLVEHIAEIEKTQQEFFQNEQEIRLRRERYRAYSDVITMPD
jgi:multimeric flavodoxin WrbA